MVWYAPFTFTAGNPLSAEEINKYLYHNMSETLIGRIKAGSVDNSEGVFFSTDGGSPNSVVGYNVGYSGPSPVGSIGGIGATTSYTNPSDVVGGYVNPSVTVATGTRALVYCQMHTMYVKTTAASQTVSAYASVAVSGATTIASSDTYSARVSGSYPQLAGNPSSLGQAPSFFRWFTNLTPGNNTFRFQMRLATTSGATLANVQDPTLLVIPFG